MIISVTAPKKGLGQTVTAINLGAAISKLVQKRLLFVDINQYCNDIEKYLSNTHITKGLDDFISLHRSKMLTEESFRLCVKEVSENIDMMGTHHCFKMKNNDIDVLVQHMKYIYDIAIIDTLGGYNRLSETFFNQSDYVVVVINQVKNIMPLILENQLYQGHAEKIIFVVNKYVETMNEQRINYTLEHIKRDLTKLGYRQPVFTLDFDVNLMNECNEQTLLNYVLGHYSGTYLNQLLEITTHILKGCNIEFESQNEVQQKGILRRLTSCLTMRPLLKQLKN